MTGQAIVRVSYGVLQTLMLLSSLPHARRYFFSERWGGYTESSRFTDAIQNPVVASALLALWIASSVSLAAGWLVVPASLVNVVLCYYFFVGLRWRGVLRGMGAPGFLSFWLAAAVFVLEFTSRFAPAVRGLGLLTLQLDFGLIMISAGLYKLAAGYRQGSGMELGMVNPEWGYWTAFWRRWSPRHPVFRFLNEMAWLTEVAAGALMLIPATRAAGGVVMLLSFVFIGSQIRLGFLPEMVIVACLLFLPMMNGEVVGVAPGRLDAVITAFLIGYLVLLPLARAGMFYNQLAHKALPRPLQRALDLFANAAGLIIWRVFTADIVGFFVRVWEPDQAGGTRRLLSDYEGIPLTHRFRQVAECIAITSVFTALRYYPSDRRVFVRRLVRYARTIAGPSSVLIFEWVAILKYDDRFDFIPAAEYTVTLPAGTVDERRLREDISPTTPAAASPVHEGAVPGSYAPLAR